MHKCLNFMAYANVFDRGSFLSPKCRLFLSSNMQCVSSFLILAFTNIYVFQSHLSY